MKTPIQNLADVLEMPEEEVRGAGHQIRLEKKIAAMKVGHAGILPTGEIVDRRDRPEAMPYRSRQSSKESDAQPTGVETILKRVWNHTITVAGANDYLLHECDEIICLEPEKTKPNPKDMTRSEAE